MLAPCRGKTLTQKRFGLEARVGIEHAIGFATNLNNSQQHKPLRSFLNVFKPLKRVSSLQELLWYYFRPVPDYCGTIILLEILLEVCPTKSQTVWQIYGVLKI